MSDETKDQKPLPEQPDPVVNPDHESVPQSTQGEGNAGEGDDPPPTDPPPPNGDHPTKKPGDPEPAP